MHTERHLARLEDKVLRYLTGSPVGEVTSMGDGWYRLSFGSARVFVGCQPVDERSTCVSIYVPVLYGLSRSSELFEYVALHAAEHGYGSLSLRSQPSGELVDLEFAHRLLGDYLDRQELVAATGAMGQDADALVGALQHRFGGMGWLDARAER